MPTRYRRINIDGKSLYKTETRLAAVDLRPGTFAIIDNDNKFALAASGAVGRLYVIDVAYHEGLTITDVVPAGHSAIGNYVEEGREFAVYVAAGTYKKDDPIYVGANGQAAPSGTNIIGFSQDDVVLGADDYIRIRCRTLGTAPAIASVTIDQDAQTLDISEGETLTLTAAVAPAEASSAVTWTSGTPANLTIDAATGLVTPLLVGSSVMTATSVADGSKTDTVTITAQA
ncbi:hypothetical protein [Pusillimonas sp. ANT_WB101]|uniref:hypothetical protein n=1 Tax=Pusillimonas sp. ANT_WB101 TaxID=2597356 RepID=UPI001CAA8828|nr:hypothetical protein [Pusillimonas sp. ANT_WB101]